MKVARAWLVALSFAATPLAGQVPIGLAFEGGGDAYRRHLVGVGTSSTASGFGVAGAGVVSLGRVLLRAAYAEALIDGVGSPPPRATLVEGMAQLGIAALPWLEFWVGPHARTYVTSAGEERWLLWEVRGAGRWPLRPGRLAVFLEAWGVADGRVDAGAFDVGRGVEGGMAVRVFGQRTWARLGYRIERVGLSGGVAETFEAITLRAQVRLVPGTVPAPE